LPPKREQALCYQTISMSEVPLPWLGSPGKPVLTSANEPSFARPSPTHSGTVRNALKLREKHRLSETASDEKPRGWLEEAAEHYAALRALVVSGGPIARVDHPGPVRCRLRARLQRLSSKSRWTGACASGRSRKTQPISAASRQQVSGGSCRSGRQLIYHGDDTVAAGAEHRSAVELPGCGRPRAVSSRTVSGRALSVRGLPIDAIIPRFIRRERQPQFGGQLRPTMSAAREAPQSGFPIEAVHEDVDLDPRQDPERREGGVQLADSSSWARSRSADSPPPR